MHPCCAHAGLRGQGQAEQAWHPIGGHCLHQARCGGLGSQHSMLLRCKVHVQQLAIEWKVEGLCAAQMGAMLELTWTVAVTAMAVAMQQLSGGLLMLPLLKSSNTECSSSCHDSDQASQECDSTCASSWGPLLWRRQTVPPTTQGSAAVEIYVCPSSSIQEACVSPCQNASCHCKPSA